MDDVPDPEVPERARRRIYTASYKRDVLAEYEAADPAGKGALLRREGHYSGQERLNTLDIAKGEMDLNDILDLDATESGTNRGRQATKAVGL